MNFEVLQFFDYTLLVVCTVDLLAITGDSALTWASPMYPKLYSNDTSVNPLGRPITSEEDSWIGSLLNFGAVIGPYPFVYIAAKFGRKVGLLCLAIPHIISFLTLAFSGNIYSYYFARFIGGMSVGGGYSLLPMYIAEVSRDANRGAMSLTLNVFWAIGNFMPYAIGPFVASWTFNSIIAVIPITFLILFVFIGPESPYYLAQVGRTEEAEKSLRLLGRKDVKQDLHGIQTYLKMNERGSILGIIKDRNLRKAFIICMVLVAAQELSGFCAVTYHLTLIFDSAGTDISPDISALIVGFTIFVSSFISPFLVDNAGRRPLTIYSCAGMCVAQIMLGVFFHLHDYTDVEAKWIQWIPLTALILYILFFNLGISTVPWTLTAELFPNNVREVVASATSSFCYLVSFVTTKTFNDMNDSMGSPGPFWIFGGLCFCCTIFSIMYVPETKGKSFTEIQIILRQTSADRKEKKIMSSLSRLFKRMCFMS
nr:facilitated trehalose transporter Tret1-like [Leptinotarsa decemlineata]